MKCSVCGSDNLEGSAYCEDCGAKLPVGAAAAAGRPGPPQTPLAAPVSSLSASRHIEAHGGGHGAPPAPHAPAAPQPVAPPAGPMVVCACGAANPAQEMYCHDCGANLKVSSAPAAPTFA